MWAPVDGLAASILRYSDGTAFHFPELAPAVPIFVCCAAPKYNLYQFPSNVGTAF